jgi:SAM-dependent methyltransferase
VSDLFAARPPRDDVLHARFVRCRDCGFVYADPRATLAEAQRFYQSVTDRGSGSLDAALGSPEWRDAVSARRAHLERAAKVLRAPPPVRFLDLGFGDGSALAAARELGWEPHGLEYADWLVDAVAERLGAGIVSLGGIEEAGIEDTSFDVVYSWHVVEHVLDIDAWLADVARVLRPGGILILGTENADGLYGKIWRGAFKLARRRTPWPPTSTDHTYWFSRSSLAAVVARQGLEPVTVSAYENRPLEILRGESLSRLRNPRWAGSLAIYVLSSVVSLIDPRAGGKIWLVALKPR